MAYIELTLITVARLGRCREAVGCVILGVHHGVEGFVADLNGCGDARLFGFAFDAELILVAGKAFGGVFVCFHSSCYFVEKINYTSITSIKQA